jgi:hypothetical protein
MVLALHFSTICQGWWKAQQSLTAATEECNKYDLTAAPWPQWTSTHRCTIHWMAAITQLWMNLNWINIWFHLGNQFCRKEVTTRSRWFIVYT